MRKAILFCSIVLAAGLYLTGCDSVDNPLAPYDGERPLTVLAVTNSFMPDIQWVGGRAAAVGVNRGSKAALDSTLVWLAMSDGNAIDSYLSVGEDGDEAAVRQYGGTPADSLSDDTVYTFWIAEESILDASLDSSARTTLNFADTTFTLKYVLNGRSIGDPDLDVDFSVLHDQRLLEERYIVTWIPADVTFRQIGLSKGPRGAYNNLVWHVVTPTGVPGTIRQPVTIGQAPPGTDVAVAWPGTGFEPTTYILWMATDEWAGIDFGNTTEGYRYFQIFSTNFD